MTLSTFLSASILTQAVITGFITHMIQSAKGADGTVKQLTSLHPVTKFGPRKTMITAQGIGILRSRWSIEYRFVDTKIFKQRPPVV